ncbi:uncharacterized protein LOC128984307 [Macrosteles quadrilineatus]|uniref:uncharacterized protein LOC128984307 n=1 Tax=Macrosteles quadrilineatus TaxID=74068 RepID=UPI0023E305F4|nr:uncharacterized protein LOC128984307 [Macrosteles quadrilineatus]
MCLANPASKVAIPCGHLCACADCVVALGELGLHNRCPYCRGIVTGFYTVFPLAAPLIGYPSVRSNLYRLRRQRQPPMPHSLAEFAAILERSDYSHLKGVHGIEDAANFFRGLIGGQEEGWTAAVFISPRLQNDPMLQQKTRLQMDATFKVLPQELNAYQLLTIYAEYMHELFPVAYAIMSSKSQAAYVGVLRYIRGEIPTWNPQIILSDFETAMRNAAQLVWPEAQLIGCFFHYAQAIYRMHQRVRMAPLINTTEANTALKLIMVLDLLPAEDIFAGVEVTPPNKKNHK